MSKKLLTTLKLGVAAVAMLAGLGANSFTSKAAFEAKHYNIKEHGGTFDGNQYKLADGTVITDAFFCDGTYTYFLQADGTPMKDRLTYHPDGVQVVYFDANGHECFDTFANVKKNIEGNPVDDLCYFGSTGNLYVNVITYDVTGTYIYYANPYGVMERNGVFQLDTNAANYAALANGCLYGYANADGTVAGFYKTAEEAANQKANTNEVQGWWKSFGYFTYDGEGNQIERQYRDGGTTYHYVTEKGKEYLSYVDTNLYDDKGYYCGYESKNYSLKIDGTGVTHYLSSEYKSTSYPGQDKTYYSKSYDEKGNVTSSTVEEYDGDKIKKSTRTSTWNDGKSKEESVTTYKYKDGTLSSATTKRTNTYGETVYKYKDKSEYDQSGYITKSTHYNIEGDEEKKTGYDEYLYTIINGKQVLAKQSYYYVTSEGKDRLSSYTEYGYNEQGQRVGEVYYSVNSDGEAKANNRYEYAFDENGNQIRSAYYRVDSNGESKISSETERTYVKTGNYWNTAKYMSYSYSNGEKRPSYGYENQYDDKGRRTKSINYEADGKDFKVEDYTVYHNTELGNTGVKDATKQVEAHRTYNGENQCTEYTVTCYIFVPYN